MTILPIVLQDYVSIVANYSRIPVMYLMHQAGYLSLFTLIAANGTAIWQFFINGGAILEVLWIYWLQSVVIGIINVYRILSTPLAIASQPVNPLHSGGTGSSSIVSVLIRYAFATFFTMHYGMFHLVYAIFLASYGASGVVVRGVSQSSATTDALFSGSIRVSWVIISGLIFAFHHLVTLIIERRQMSLDAGPAPDIRQVMMRPYRRILPMHLIIIVGPIIAAWFGEATVFAVFMLLKTLVDVWLFFKGTSHPGNINPSQP